jgi:hypothetical protein
LQSYLGLPRYLLRVGAIDATRTEVTVCGLLPHTIHRGQRELTDERVVPRTEHVVVGREQNAIELTRR